MRQLTVIPKENFVDCLEKCNEYWGKCINSEEESFEKEQGIIALGSSIFVYTKWLDYICIGLEE